MASARSRVAVLVAALVLGIGASKASAQVVAAAVPGSLIAGFATPVLAVQVGGTITFANFDIQNHNLIHQVGACGSLLSCPVPGAFDDAPGPGDQLWCSPLVFPSGCPRFFSANASLGGTVQVQGLGNLEAGHIYPFLCTIHPNMKGYLIALPPS